MLDKNYVVMAKSEGQLPYCIGIYTSVEAAVGASYINAFQCIDILKETRDSFNCYIYLDAYVGKIVENTSTDKREELVHINVYKNREGGRESIYKTFSIFATGRYD